MKSGVVLDNRYELVRLLGSGAMGAVWQGTDLKIRRPVAVKIVLDHTDPRLTDRMVREATAAGRLSHPHIATVHDYGQTLHESVLVTYIVMELVGGRPLTSVLAEGRSDLAVTLGWAQQITLALGAAHAPGVGVVHRDLKPDNILITNDGLVKLVDFGIARFIGDGHLGDTRLTKPGMLIGTPAYMAPEQCLSKPVDGRTDLYALGCLLYEMVTGSPPFTEGSPLTVALAHVHDTPVAPRSRNEAVPAELDLLIRDLLAKDPDLRPDDAATVYQRLAAIATTHHGALRTTSMRRLLAPSPRTPVHDLGQGEPLDWYSDVDSSDAKGDPSKAARLSRAAAAELTDSLGPYHERTLTARYAHAWFAGVGGSHTEAGGLWRELIPDLQYVLGHFHRTTHGAQRLLAWNTGMAGDSAEAVSLLRELIPDATRLLGHRHLDILEARRFLAWNEGELRRHSKAVRLLRKLVADLTDVMGADHENTLEARRLLAWNTEKSGDHVKAVQLLRELLPDSTRALGPDHEQCVDARRLLALYTQ